MHILSSDKPIIVLYAGGWHSRNIRNFLTETLNYQVKHEARTDEDELRESELNHIDNGYGGPALVAQSSQAQSNSYYERDNAYELDGYEYEYICEDCGRPISLH